MRSCISVAWGTIRNLCHDFVRLHKLLQWRGHGSCSAVRVQVLTESYGDSGCSGSSELIIEGELREKWKKSANVEFRARCSPSAFTMQDRIATLACTEAVE